MHGSGTVNQPERGVTDTAGAEHDRAITDSGSGFGQHRILRA
jgi:hypothetical protein